jgi:ectoine hydroxylase-related dioxygenase (phytanoyl-CoA dioxygenase family)
MLRRAGTRLSRALAARPRASSPLAWSSSSSRVVDVADTAGPPGLLARASYCHDASALSPFAGSDAPAMPAADKFLFDTNGFVIVRGVFGADDLARFHAGVDAHAHEIHERRGQLRLTATRTPLSGDGVTGRKDLAGFLGWDAPHRDPFREVLAHPRLVPYLHELVGPGYRLDHNPLLIMQDPGAEGFEFHGGSVLDNGEWNHPLGYDFRHGKMRCNLLAFAVHLTDVAEGEGGFCVIRGSHKSNFPCPPEMRRYETAVEHAYQPAVNAGDVVVFTEATTHGTLPWRGKAQRRNIIYRFSPATCAYGRGYVERGGWPEAYTRGMTEAQRATMEMPYHPRLNRVAVKPDASGATKPAPREKHKVEFDRAVFKSDYF